jgi:hypothetical protein
VAFSVDVKVGGTVILSVGLPTNLFFLVNKA